MKAFISISVAAAIVTGLVLTSCSPEPRASSKLTPGANSADLSAEHTKNAPSTSTPTSPLAGDWICPSSQCTYEQISVSEKDGSVTLTIPQDHDSSKMAPGFAEQLSLDADNEELVLNGEHYIRKPAPSPSESETK